PEDAAVHRLEAVAHVRQRPLRDDRHGVVEERPLHLLLDLDRFEVAEDQRSLIAVIRRKLTHMSRNLTSLALVMMNCLRLSTSSPISRAMAVSASAASSPVTCRSVRWSGSMVVTWSSSQSISPRPLSRWKSFLWSG